MQKKKENQTWREKIKTKLIKVTIKHKKGLNQQENKNELSVVEF